MLFFTYRMVIVLGVSEASISSSIIRPQNGVCCTVLPLFSFQSGTSDFVLEYFCFPFQFLFFFFHSARYYCPVSRQASLGDKIGSWSWLSHSACLLHICHQQLLFQDERFVSYTFIYHDFTHQTSAIHVRSGVFFFFSFKAITTSFSCHFHSSLLLYYQHTVVHC